MLGICFDEFYDLSDAKRNKMEHKYKPKKLFLKHSYDYSMWSDKTESSDEEELFDKEEFEDLSDKPPLEGDEEKVKEGKGLKTLTPKKLLTTRFSL